MKVSFGCRRLMMLALAMGALLGTGPAEGADTWEVDNFADLRHYAINANPGDEIVIAAGNYHVTSSLYVTTPDLTFRGATGNRDDVVLYGNGMNEESGVLEGFWAAASGIQLRDLTIRDFWHHGIHICGNPYADDVVVSNIKTVNCGERHVKGSASSGISDNVLIENLWMEQTEEYQPRLDHKVDKYNYIGGIDAMHLNNWTIRDCTAVNIRGATGAGRAAFFLWNGVSNLLLEQNTVIRCGHGISIGNPSGPNNSHVDPWHAVGGTIRNNFILRRGESIDNWAMELDNTKDFNVHNNTIYSEDATYFRTLQIYDAVGEGLTENLELINNILRGRIFDLTTAGGWTSTNDIVDGNGNVVLPEWFVDAAGGNLHLTEQALLALNQALALAEVTDDIDGGPRPAGSFPDIGADEYGSPAGDANYDGQVDGLDYNLWSLHYQQAGNWGEGNFNGDVLVDGLDYNIWSLNYGFGSEGAGGLPVPEPAFALLLMAGLGPVLRHRSKR